MPSHPRESRVSVEAIKAAQRATHSTDAWCELALQAALPYIEADLKERLLGDESIPTYTISRCPIHRVEFELRRHDFAICPQCGDDKGIEHVVVVAFADFPALQTQEESPT